MHTRTWEIHFGYVVEADIKGFFNHIDHDILLGLLAQRIDDKRFLGLIRKWLKAGILEEDLSIQYPEEGTPQGGSTNFGEYLPAPCHRRMV